MKKKNSIVMKVYSYIKNKKGTVTLAELYDEFSNHPKSSLRGNINREILKGESSILKRIGKSMYDISIEVTVEDNGDTVTVIETKKAKVLNIELFRKRRSRVFDKNSILLSKIDSMASGENCSFFDMLDNSIPITNQNDIVASSSKISNSSMPNNNSSKKDEKWHLSLVGATRTDLGKSREKNDFYPTPDYVIRDILDREELLGSIWEPCCGDGAISKILKEYYPNSDIHSSDLIDRGYGDRVGVDFLTDDTITEVDNIITNPPFKGCEDFILKSLKVAKNKVIMFLKIQALEGRSRFEKLFKNNKHLKKVYVYVNRVSLYKGGSENKGGSTMCFAWFVWDKNYIGYPQIDWIS